MGAQSRPFFPLSGETTSGGSATGWDDENPAKERSSTELRLARLELVLITPWRPLQVPSIPHAVKSTTPSPCSSPMGSDHRIAGDPIARDRNRMPSHNVCAGPPEMANQCQLRLLGDCSQNRETRKMGQDLSSWMLRPGSRAGLRRIERPYPQPWHAIRPGCEKRKPQRRGWNGFSPLLSLEDSGLSMSRLTTTGSCPLLTTTASHGISWRALISWWGT